MELFSIKIRCTFQLVSTINIQKLAESSGFLSRSNFIKLFSEKEGCTPAKWKKANRE